MECTTNNMYKANPVSRNSQGTRHHVMHIFLLNPLRLGALGSRFMAHEEHHLLIVQGQLGLVHEAGAQRLNPCLMH
jgi:hypothetical protein